MNPEMLEEVRIYFSQLQERLLLSLEKQTQEKFFRDDWSRKDEEGKASLTGHGCTAFIECGHTLEKAGINFSFVSGKSLPQTASQNRLNLAQSPFTATGLSLILHPRNPHLPTVHFNLRFFTIDQEQQKKIWWFGGGMDLTPYYAVAEDCIHFHRVCKAALDPFGFELYPAFKKRCDDYFYLPHRQEARGIGGIFFDDFSAMGFSSCFAVVQALGHAFSDAYLPIFERRKNKAYTEAERAFQALRRGRYVEFNLLHDRGTLFGLQSGGRTQSILMSMPPTATWCYEEKWPEDSAEAQLYRDFLPVRDWVELSHT